MKTIESITAKAKQDILKRYEVETISDFSFGYPVFRIEGMDKNGIRHDKKKNPVLIIDFPENTDEGLHFPVSHNFDLGVLTPAGYLSTKKLDINIDRDIDCDTELIEAEVLAVSGYIATEFKVNTFDPFYDENEANRRNASAWNYIAANYITDPWCTR